MTRSRVISLLGASILVLLTTSCVHCRTTCIPISHQFSASPPSSRPTTHPTMNPAEQPSSSVVDDFNARRESYIDTCLQETSKFNIILSAFRNLEIDPTDLQNIIDDVEVNTENASFNIPDLVRLLFFNTTAMQYEASIKAAALKFHLWITHNDKNSVWWTENKSILYLSSHFLFNQMYSWSNFDSTHLRERLLHWLQLKVDYGFYELGSRVYSPYTLKGLLNLADFCKDVQIRDLAAAVAQRLLRELLLSSNDQGVSFSVATRDYWQPLLLGRKNNYNKLVYLLTGQAHVSDIAPSAAGVYLATTSLDVSPVFTYWGTHVDVSYFHGHPLAELSAINSVLSSEVDQILFQWIAGAYFFDHSHAERSKTLLDMYHLWNHSDFVQYGIAPFESYSLEQYLGLVAQPAVEVRSKGTVLTGANVSFYKDESAMLSSMTRWHSGSLGHQAVPWVASTGQQAVFGVVGAGQAVPQSGTCASQGLPYVVQSHNVLLAGYHPDATLRDMTLGAGGNVDVLIRWPFASFDETVVVGNWTASREGDSYVALRHVFLPAAKAGGVVTGADFIWSDADPSVWAVVVGNANVHGSFSGFISTLEGSEVSSALSPDGESLSSRITVQGYTLTLDFDI